MKIWQVASLISEENLYVKQSTLTDLIYFKAADVRTSIASSVRLGPQFISSFWNDGGEAAREKEYISKLVFSPQLATDYPQDGPLEGPTRHCFVWADSAFWLLVRWPCTNQSFVIWLWPVIWFHLGYVRLTKVDTAAEIHRVYTGA